MGVGEAQILGEGGRVIELRWFQAKDAPNPVLQYRVKVYTVKKGESLVAGVEVTMSEWVTAPVVVEA